MKRVLVFHIGSLGDTIVSIPALRALRLQVGESCLVTLLHNHFGPDLAGPREILADTGLVDDFIAYPTQGTRLELLRAHVGLWRAVRRRRFSTAVYLMRSERTRLASIRDRVFFRACGIRHLTGFYAIPRALLYRRTRDGYAASVPHESERLVARVAEDRCVESSVYGFPLLPIVGDDRWECVRHLKSIRRFPQRPMVAVCPGCKRNANRWPQESFVELTRLLAKTGQFEIVLIGGPAESGAGLAIGRAVDGVIDCCGRLGIRDSAAILSLCSLAVGLNTGTTHLAAALGIPCVAVYAAQDSPGQWDPLGTSHRLLRRRIQCEGCRAERCPRPDHPCMSGITPTEVFDAVMEVAASTRPGRREPGGSVLTPGLALPGV